MGIYGKLDFPYRPQINENGGRAYQGGSCLFVPYVKKADVGKRGCCHIFRHSMATLMLENGADIRHIQLIQCRDRGEKARFELPQARRGRGPPRCLI